MSMSVGSSTSSMPVIELTVDGALVDRVGGDVECASMMPGRDELAGRVDDLRARRHRDVGADRGDLAVAEDDRAVLDGAARDRHHRSAADGDGAAARRLGLLAAHGDGRLEKRGHYDGESAAGEQVLVH